MNEPMPRLVAEADFRARFTTAEFLRMNDAGAFDDMKVELVHGELERMNLPRREHSRLQGEIYAQLRVSVVGDPALEAYTEIGIDLGDDTMLGCDAALVRPLDDENRMLLAEEVLLVVEVALSTLRRDLGLKRDEYARAGIPNYWVVDGENKVVHVFATPVDGAYPPGTVIAFGAPLPVPGTDRTIVIE